MNTLKNVLNSVENQLFYNYQSCDSSSSDEELDCITQNNQNTSHKDDIKDGTNDGDYGTDDGTDDGKDDGDISDIEDEEEIGLNPFWKRYKYQINSTMTLLGHSRAAEKSCFLIPELGIFFDAALQSLVPPTLICITHCHSDHSQALPLLLTNPAIQGRVPVYVPEQHIPLFDQYIKSHFQLTTGYANFQPSFYELRPAKPGESYTVPLKGKNYRLQIFKCYHTVPTVGYGLSEERKKLKAQYVGLKPAEIIALKKQVPPVEITELIALPIIAYLCDTTHHVLENPEVFKYPIIMIEVTMLFPEHEKMANKNKHICWHQITEQVKQHPNNLFILIHFSMRYKWKTIETFFDKVKAVEGIQNILVWKN